MIYNDLPPDLFDLLTADSLGTIGSVEYRFPFFLSFFFFFFFFSLVNKKKIRVYIPCQLVVSFMVNLRGGIKKDYQIREKAKHIDQNYSKKINKD